MRSSFPTHKYLRLRPTEASEEKPAVQIHANGLVQNLEYQGQLSKKELDQIIQNYPVYKQAADHAKIPWKMLAAIHYRESGLSPKQRSNGGPFQFHPPLNQGEEAFASGAAHAARLLQQKSGHRLSPQTTDAHLIKDAFWGYNGRVQSSYDWSAYVMSRFDADHENMRLRGTILNEAGEKIRVDIVDRRMGAYTIYTELLKAFE